MNYHLKLKRQKYYNQTFVKFELLKAMKSREVVLMDKYNNEHCIRGLFITSLDFLNSMFDTFNFYDRSLNIYVSNAIYKHIPFFTLKLTDRSKETSEWFNTEAENNIIGYDIFLDFDSDNTKQFSRMMLEIYKFVKILMYEKIKFTLFPSGTGFQLIIPDEVLSFNYPVKKDIFFDNSMTKNNIVKTLTETIKERFHLRTLCLKGIGTFNKIRKCQYSLVDEKVVLPLSNEYMFRNFLDMFNYNEMDCNIVSKTIHLKNRGLRFLNDFDSDTNKKNFDNFLNKYMLKEGILKNE